MIATRTGAILGAKASHALDERDRHEDEIISADREINTAAKEAQDAIRESERRAGFGGVLEKLKKQEIRKDEQEKENTGNFFRGTSAKVKDMFKGQGPAPIAKAPSQLEVVAPRRSNSLDMGSSSPEDGTGPSENEILDAASSNFYLGERYLEFAKLARWAWQHPWFSSYMFLCIGTAGIVVGLQTYPQYEFDPVLYMIDLIILISFSLEIVLKMIGEGFKPWNFFTNREWKWNWFDFMIVFFSLPFLPFGGGGQLKLLRLIRLMRLTKVFKRIPQLNMIMRGLLDSLNFVSYIVLLWFLVIYLYAITGLLLFEKNDPWHYRSLEYAFITLFQITVMDFWGEIMYINYYGCREYPSVLYTNDPDIGTDEIGGLMFCAEPQAQPVATIIYFLSYVTITAFCIIPLFIGAVTISMADCVVEMKEEEKRAHRQKCIEKVDEYVRSLEDPSKQDRKMKMTVKLVGYAFKGNDITLDIHRERSNVWLFQQYRDLAYWAGEVIEHPKVQGFITGVIMLAGLVVGMQTDAATVEEYGDFLNLMNDLIQYTFTWELVMKVIAEGEHPYMYFSSGWNTFDFVVVAGSYLPAAGSGVVILRLLRLFRVLKLMRALPQLQVIITGATKGLSAALYILVIIGIIYYFFAILANAAFADNDPASWGEIHVGMIILVQLATLDNWTTYFYTMVFGCDLQPAPTMFSEEECDKPNAQFGLGTLYFVIYTIFGSYVLLALFVGSIGMAMDEANNEQNEERKILRRVDVLQRQLGLSTEAVSRFREVFTVIDITERNRIGRDEMKFGLRVAGEILNEQDFEGLWRKVDKDDTDDIDFSEFLIFMLDLRQLQMDKMEALEAQRAGVEVVKKEIDNEYRVLKLAFSNPDDDHDGFGSDDDAPPEEATRPRTDSFVKQASMKLGGLGRSISGISKSIAGAGAGPEKVGGVQPRGTRRQNVLSPASAAFSIPSATGVTRANGDVSEPVGPAVDGADAETGGALPIAVSRATPSQLPPLRAAGPQLANTRAEPQADNDNESKHEGGRLGGEALTSPDNRQGQEPQALYANLANWRSKQTAVDELFKPEHEANNFEYFDEFGQLTPDKLRPKEPKHNRRTKYHILNIRTQGNKRVKIMAI